jgi:hypothetical protein
MPNLLKMSARDGPHARSTQRAAPPPTRPRPGPRRLKPALVSPLIYDFERASRPPLGLSREVPDQPGAADTADGSNFQVAGALKIGNQTRPGRAPA